MGDWWLGVVATPISVTCAEIGNCTAKTPTLSAGFANITHILVVLVGLLAVVFVIVSGLQIALAAGDSKRYQQGIESLKYSVVGVVLAIMAYAIVTFIATGF